MRVWDGLDEKEKTYDVIKGYVEVNEEVERDTMRYLGEVWTEIHRNERNRVMCYPNLKINKMCLVTKGL